MSSKRAKVKKSEILEKITREYIDIVNRISKLPDEPEFVFWKWDKNSLCHKEKRTTKKDVLDSFFIFSPTLQATTLEGHPYILP